MGKFAVFIFSFLLLSCSLQKRTYRKGYYVDWNRTSKTIQSGRIEKTDAEESILVSNEKQYQLSEKKIDKQNELIQTPICTDTILLKNGSKISGVKLIQIKKKEVVYDDCKGIKNVVKKRDVYKVKYIDEKTNLLTVWRSYPRPHPLALLSPTLAIIATILSFFSGDFYLPIFLLLTGVISGIIGMRIIKRLPLSYDGNGYAIIGLIFFELALYSASVSLWADLGLFIGYPVIFLIWPFIISIVPLFLSILLLYFLVTSPKPKQIKNN